ncbi:MAG: nucleotidyltransferase family protein [Planctomycetes bacterium]|nr:nucleotidyltransferase family protein [Planctomycetota bacterium]
MPVILAAGASARMGRPKALCEFEGKATLLLALEACREAGVAPPVTVLGYDADAIRASVDLTGAGAVVNPNPDHGQTSSLKVGLRAVPPDAEAFLLYPADHPLITANEISPLVAEYRRLKGSKQIFIPSCNLRRGHPVLVDMALRDEFLRIPDASPARTVYTLHAERIAYVEVPTLSILMDMDTPEDYARCLEEYRRREETKRRARKEEER